MTCVVSRWTSLAGACLFEAACLAASTMVCAQTADLRLGAEYQCPNNLRFKVFSCAGTGNADACDVEAAVGNQPSQRGQSPRQQVTLLLQVCHLQTPAEAQGAASGAGVQGNSQPDANGFKIGDTVNVATAGGWYAAVIVRAMGDSYLVRLGPSTEVTKSYPTELRRIGPLTDVDRARGLFALHDKVQVNVGGRWLDGEIITELGMEYQVQLPDSRTAWASAPNLRRVAIADKPAAPAAGAPPRPGLKSCAGKFEGRCASTAAAVGSFQIVFRSGKATVKELGGEEQFECWMDSEKIYLHKPGELADNDMPIDINDDGTLQTPFGELKKKGN